MLAAVNSMRRRKAGKVIVSVPVASSSAYHLVREKADELISLIVAETPYFAVAGFDRHWLCPQRKPLTVGDSGETASCQKKAFLKFHEKIYFKVINFSFVRL